MALSGFCGWNFKRCNLLENGCTRHYDWNMNQGFKVDSSHVLRGTCFMAQLCSGSVDVVQVIKVMNGACSMNKFQSLGDALTDRLVSAPVWWCWNMAKICHSWRMSWCATLLCRSFPSLSWYCSFGSFVYCMCFSLFFAWVLSLSAWNPPGFTACAFRNCSSFLAFRVAVSTACCSWAWLGVAWHKFSLWQPPFADKPARGSTIWSSQKHLGFELWV